MSKISTDRLDIEYGDSGPGGRAPVLLLHGWPDDATTWDGVAPVLNNAGLRTVAPTLRGFGETRFRSDSTPRTGNSGILAMDAIALMDALGIERFRVAGHDWGSNIAEALAVGWPDRVVRHDPRGFAHIMWVNWSPKGWFEESTFEQVARSFGNPDWVDVTLHSYRARWNEAEPDPSSAWLEKKVRETKQLALPCIYLQGEEDGVNPPSASENVAAKFAGSFERVVLPGVGHFPMREAPDEVAGRLARHFL